MKRFLFIMVSLFAIGLAIIFPPVVLAVNTYSIDLETADDSFLSRADAVPLSITGDYTIELWFNLESLPTSGDQRVLAGKNDEMRLSYRLNGANREFICATLVGGAERSLLYTDNTITTATWYHIRCVRDSDTGEFTLYLDNVMVDTEAETSGAGTDSANAFIIGYTDTGSGAGLDYFDGQIDEVRWWNTGSSTVAYDACAAGTESGAVGVWHLDNVLTDATANAFTLTNNNSATFSTSVPTPLTSGCGAVAGRRRIIYFSS